MFSQMTPAFKRGDVRKNVVHRLATVATGRHEGLIELRLRKWNVSTQ
ncbi:hypothetical protein RRSWK_04154 [Rhodopirellula sp. SWK7]|nr:hypothetical protein RRSWK_04154 [Rhodopirellula sp. SWK7]